MLPTSTQHLFRYCTSNTETRDFSDGVNTPTPVCLRLIFLALTAHSTYLLVKFSRSTGKYETVIHFRSHFYPDRRQNLFLSKVGKNLPEHVLWTTGIPPPRSFLQCFMLKISSYVFRTNISYHPKMAELAETCYKLH